MCTEKDKIAHKTSIELNFPKAIAIAGMWIGAGLSSDHYMVFIATLFTGAILFFKWYD